MHSVSRRRPLSSLIALAVAAALLAIVLVDGSGEMMAALPAALLALAIAFKRYPGEKLLLRIARRFRRPRARRATAPRLPDLPGHGMLPMPDGVPPLRGPPLLSSTSI